MKNKDEIKDLILGRNYLYRGTNNVLLEMRKEEGFYYGYYDVGLKEYLTSFSLDLFDAMVAGVGRCEEDIYKEVNAKPLLIAIDSKKYISSLQSGLEFDQHSGHSPSVGAEIEAKGKIDLEDIIVIDSLDKFQKFVNYVRKLEIFPGANEERIDYFKRYFEGVIYYFKRYFL